MSENAIVIENLRKQYRLGVIGGGTLNADLQSWWARKVGKEDPNTKIGKGKSTNQEFWALDGINLTVNQGEALGIIGTNGAGKSTLLKILSRVTAPTEGDVWINGRISSLLEVGTGFHAELTGRENVYMNGAILGMSRKEVDEKITDIIEFSECGKFIDTPVKRYSSGMYVKLAFAVAAHLDADIMVMDEVLAVGDMKFQEKCLSKMGDSANNDGKTVLYVSHNMNTIRQLCTRCVVLEAGKIIFDGDTENAISMYMGTNSIIKGYIDLGNQKRSFSMLDHVHILGTQVMNEENIVDDYLIFSMDIVCNKKCENVFMRIIVNFQDDTPAGMSISEYGYDYCELGEKTGQYKLDVRNLAPGRYYAKIVLFRVNEYGTDELIDCVEKALYFEKKDSIAFSQNMVWSHRWWGHSILGNVKKVEE